MPNKINARYIEGLPVLGFGQTWQDMSGSRVAGTTYTNDTGRPIQVCIELVNTNGRDFQISPDGVSWVTVAWSSGGGFYTVTATVPNNHRYRVLTSYTAGRWAEL